MLSESEKGSTEDDKRYLVFGGGAALSLGDKTNYAVLIRLALLAAMEANQGGNYLGFRCVREEPAHVSGVTQ